MERRDDDFTMIAAVGCMRADFFLRFIGILSELEDYAINVSAGEEVWVGEWRDVRDQLSLWFG